MANGDGVFSLFQDIHVRIDMKIDTFTSIKPTTTKSRKQLYLEDSTQMREVKQDHVTNRKNISLLQESFWPPNTKI